MSYCRFKPSECKQAMESKKGIEAITIFLDFVNQCLCGFDSKKKERLLQWASSLLTHKAPYIMGHPLLTGPSNCGKSTFAKILTRLLRQEYVLLEPTPDTFIGEEKTELLGKQLVIMTCSSKCSLLRHKITLNHLGMASYLLMSNEFWCNDKDSLFTLYVCKVPTDTKNYFTRLHQVIREDSVGLKAIGGYLLHECAP